MPVRKGSHSFPLAPHWALFPYGAASGEMCLAIPIFPAEVPLSSYQGIFPSFPDELNMSGSFSRWLCSVFLAAGNFYSYFPFSPPQFPASFRALSTTTGCSTAISGHKCPMLRQEQLTCIYPELPLAHFPTAAFWVSCSIIYLRINT